jgi:beta-glucanase (GH16 family)
MAQLVSCLGTVSLANYVESVLPSVMLIDASDSLIGVLLSGYLVYDGLASVEQPSYCSIWEEDFSSGILDSSIWLKEAEVGGFGNGQFEQTTNTDENVFIKDGILNLKPTLQDSRLIETNNTINLTASGLCTSDLWSNCVISTNTTNGTIVNPVKSARISTRKSKSIQYGRVEVVAKLPQGDWLWPAIWMLPVNDTYGPWPTSGEV